MKTSTKKILSLALTILMVVCCLSACGKTVQKEEDTSKEEAFTTEQPQLPKDVNIAVLKGPTGMGMVKMMENAATGSNQYNYNFTVSSAPDEVVSGLINNQYLIAAVPTNLAATLYQKTEGNIQVAAVNTLGVLYLLENGDTIHSVEDLRGKTIYATGQGSTPEYILNYILKKNGIDPSKDVTITYLAEHSELASQMTAGSVVLGMLPEPNVTAVMAQNSDVHIALNLTEEWEKVNKDTTVMMGCIVVNKKLFADKYPNVFAAFLSEYKASTKFVNQDLDSASALIEKYEIMPKAALAKKAIPNSNITFMDGDEMQTKLSAFLQVLYDANPASVGGKMPEADFYYKK